MKTNLLILFYGLLAFSAFFAWRVIRQLMSQYRHISEAEQKQFIEGNVDKTSPEGERIFRHLAICDQCRNAIEQLSDTDF
ncbi:MAG: hypothetical protein AAF598_07245 [Bacteroidota bacterium]